MMFAVQMMALGSFAGATLVAAMKAHDSPSCLIFAVKRMSAVQMLAPGSSAGVMQVAATKADHLPKN
eukprot:CAMPEP_0172684738 /NCGR_PEP_ID=MMETSP1074-20121228/19768_1 /TAXON_ID=2916 /ORGANISM="Ceratium fusus, Strain PA161109" /LENGTH=66 /DNA_ID=CAMNT_0013503797 /DNA_START=490 /DNA_END=690 /DNA_ORIENTATION=+